MALDYILRNCSTFADGYGLHGAVASITLPKFTEVVEEHRGGGMDGPVEVALGYEKLEASVELADADPRVIGLWGLAPGQTKAFTHKGFLVGETGTDRAAEIHTRGSIKELDFGDWKPGELAKLTYAMRLTYVKLTIADVPLIEVDVLNGIRVINGVDQNVAMRRALGMA
ncbi:hypothetical protein GGR16_004634 [Chelatococcus caeni]|uniref:Phage major tail tube protein n=1 Tax=Chelatococcus caeni TaxID=1348468 RepID=A0A840C842_9HYPH|nr:phage major tail tube protein [Chelatococcus caeni]MBB4019579.1 hypothetical protein [Chelatococcus caeni]